jgi:hypothetical protein
MATPAARLRHCEDRLIVVAEHRHEFAYGLPDVTRHDVVAVPQESGESLKAEPRRIGLVDLASDVRVQPVTQVPGGVSSAARVVTHGIFPSIVRVRTRALTKCSKKLTSTIRAITA